jgi:cell division protein FtsI/penicillin-binding protein 2
MAKRLQIQRLAGLAVLLCVAFGGLAYRLVDLQILRHEELSLKAQQNTEREFLLQPRRGDILDIKGNLLATSALVKTVCADPTLLGNRRPEVAHCLAPLLELNEARLAESLMPRVRQNARSETVTNLCVVLKRKVPVETWEKIHSAMARLTFGVDEKGLKPAERSFYHNLRAKAVYAQDDQLRIYPNQTLAAHVLGFATAEDREVNDTPISEICGRDGIERSLDAKLRGVPGWRLTETDRQKRELVTLREQDVEPRNGLNVVLTIDSVIQHILESALAEAMEKHSPLSVSGLVIRPRTGEVLAMATLPDFDPNHPADAPLEARRNRVISDIAEPGSTFKVVVVAGALNDGTVRLHDVFDCEHGHFFYAGRPLRDHESYGPLSVEQIITHSSNIGAAKVSIKMGEQRLYEYICEFGFGANTGIPLPGEVSAWSFVPSPKKSTKVAQWSKVSIAQIPMGQGLCVTRLQMTLAVCAIANHGWLMRPMLVDRLEDGDHSVVAKYSPQRVRQVISEPAAKLMVQALKTVVGPEGTAPKAALEHYTAAGKTGTAQKAENGVYVHDKYFSSFIGFFPADNPELCISVMLDEPDRKKGYYGGQIAAPVFKQIAERAANYLNIRPEDGEAPSPPEPVLMPVDNRGLKTAAARSQ